VDSSPTTLFRWQQSEQAAQPGRRAGGPTGWNADRSGYDGWLAGAGDDPGTPA
jgi:hypothetical protein